MEQDGTSLPPAQENNKRRILLTLIIGVAILLAAAAAYYLYSLSQFNSFVNAYAAYGVKQTDSNLEALKKGDDASVVLAGLENGENYSFEANRDKINEAKQMLQAAFASAKQGCDLQPPEAPADYIYLSAAQKEYVTQAQELESRAEESCREELRLSAPVAAETVPAVLADSNKLTRAGELLGGQDSEAFVSFATENFAKYDGSHAYPNEDKLQELSPKLHQGAQDLKAGLGSLYEMALAVENNDEAGLVASLQKLSTSLEAFEQSFNDKELERLSIEELTKSVDLNVGYVEMAKHFNKHSLQNNILGGNDGARMNTAAAALIGTGVNLHGNKNGGKSPQTDNVNEVIKEIDNAKITKALQGVDLSGITYRNLGSDGYTLTFQDSITGATRTVTSSPSGDLN